MPPPTISPKSPHYRLPTQFTIIPKYKKPFHITTVAYFPLTGEADLLSHLYYSKLARDMILSQITVPHTEQCDGFLLTHPLLFRALYVPPYATDADLLYIINRYFDARNPPTTLYPIPITT